MRAHMRRGDRGVMAAALLLAVVPSSCSSGTTPHEAPDAGSDASLVGPGRELAESPEAAARVATLQARFVLKPWAAEDPLRGDAVAPAARPVLAEGVVERFALVDAGRLRPVVRPLAKRGVMRTASVILPGRAGGFVDLEDDQSHVALRFTLDRTDESRVELAGGLALYRHAIDGADLVHRVHAEGTEDFVVYESRPAREELAYRLDVSRVAGLRLVGDTLEFLDGEGTPRLRVAPPYVVDATGRRQEARLALDGCAYDSKPMAPFGRAVTRPGAGECRLRVTWAGVAYPAIVDPSWGATGSMAVARTAHTATLLNSGKVLVTGGASSGGLSLSSAELFDGIGSFATLGAMTAARSGHAATLLNSGKVLILGGYGISYLSSAELFDGASFAPTGSMAAARRWPMVTLLGSGKVLVAGGYDGTLLASAELFDGIGSFAVTGSMTTPRLRGTATLLSSGKVLIAGGSYQAGNYPLASAELFNGVNAFAATGSMATARIGALAVPLSSGKVLIAGGSNGSTYYSSAELYDGTSAFSPTGSMVAPRTAATATRLGSGKVLISGGYNPGGFQPGCDLFDGTALFAATGALGTARENHTATVLGSGKVLVAGGDNGSSLSSAELFDVWPAGHACVAGDECVSGLCVDGVCCNASCTGSCQACDVAGSLGTCTNVIGGVHGARPSCGAYACSGASASCPTTCAGDAACASGYFCNGGACVALRANGQTCATGGHECASGNCVDSVCCDGACAGQCQACDVGGSLGKCVGVLGAPHGQHGACTGTGVGTACGPSCDGVDVNACHYASATTSCGTKSCSLGVVTEVSTCDTLGTCKPASRSCGAYACDGASCAIGCVTSAQCAAGYYCSAGACVADQANGAACGGADACTSGNCVDGTCCATNACGAGMKCNVPGSLGTCANPPGVSCASASDCGTGFCVDGYCCDTKCDEQCKACNAPGKVGSCSVIAGAPHGTRLACGGAGAGTACGATCDGVDGKTCHLPDSTVSCGAATCAAGIETHVSVCDGAGGCSDVPKPCGTFVCDTLACKSSCSSNADCVGGNYCKSGGCIAQEPDGAACGDNSMCASGFCTDGVCCNVGSCGSQRSCSAGTKGVCTSLNGASCSAATECASGNCVDGYCCDGQCTGQCESCAESGSLGACTPIRGTPRGSRPACAKGSVDLCGDRTCDGTKDRASCAGFVNASSTTCSQASCTGTTLTTAGTCDGAGSCAAGTTTTCPGGNTCDPAAGGACRTGCSADSDCATGYRCDAGKCINGATCSDDRGATIASTGERTPCAPILCDPTSGVCGAACRNELDCATGFTCDSTGACVVRAAPTPDQGGCSTSRGSGTDAAAGLGALAVVAITLLARSRSRAAGSSC